MSGIAAGLTGFAVLLALMVLRIPIGVAMLGVGIGGYAMWTGTTPLLAFLKTSTYYQFSTYSLSVIPLFVLMGEFATQAGMSRALYRTAAAFLGHRKGGLAMASIGGCAAFGAICGSSLATAATMGQVALPEMRRYNYSGALATGSLAAGGNLDILIPPSVILVLYELMAEMSIAKMFVAAMVPGVLAAIGYMLAVAIFVARNPEDGPAGPRATWPERFAALRETWSLILIVALVIVGMYRGWFTPTEAAAVGAFGTMVLAVLHGGMRLAGIANCLRGTAMTSAMIFLILLGAETRVVMLGTGTPVPNPDRAGPGVAIVHDGKAYLFDAGPGVVLRMIQAANLTSVDPSQAKGIKELAPMNVEHLFIIDLHSDHTLDYPELASTLWWRRNTHLNATGPVGLQAMTDSYYAMQKVDIDLRTGGNQPVKDPTMYKVNVTEIGEDGIVHDADGVTVEAFSVSHGDIHPAYGYKITTPDRTIVFSGDTTYSDVLAEKAKGADVVIHEVISEEGWSALSPEWQEYRHTSHTLTSEVAKVANEAKPGLLVLTHVLHYGAPLESALTEVQAQYDGKVVLAKDLDEF